MPAAYAAVSVALAAALVLAGAATLTRSERVVGAVRRVGVPEDWLPWLSAAQFAGAAGLLAGIAVPPLGVAAAAGVVLYFLGAVAGHVRAGDRTGLGLPTALLALAVTALALRTATLN